MGFIEIDEVHASREIGNTTCSFNRNSKWVILDRTFSAIHRALKRIIEFLGADGNSDGQKSHRKDKISILTFSTNAFTPILSYESQ